MAQSNDSPTLRIPPEWELHTQTIMVWPASPRIWGSASFLAKVRTDIARIASAISPFEPVTLIVDPSQITSAKAAFNTSDLDSGPITLLPLPVDDLWARDTLPVFGIQKDPEGAPYLVGIDLNFNGWGNKQVHQKDGKLAESFLLSRNITRLSSPLVGEGGALEFDGQGTLLVTESSLLNKNRNPSYSTRAEIETELKSLLGVDKVIWFTGVKDQDITDAHVDCLVRFVGPGVVLLNRPHKGSKNPDVWSRSSDEALAILGKATDAKGRSFRIIQLPEANPDKIVTVRGRESEFLASYVNYLVVNGGVIVPEFGDSEADREAVRVIQGAYPDRKVVPVRMSHLASGGGGIHCSTHDIPSLDGVSGEKNGAGRMRLF